MVVPDTAGAVRARQKIIVWRHHASGENACSPHVQQRACATVVTNGAVHGRWYESQCIHTICSHSRSDRAVSSAAWCRSDTAIKCSRRFACAACSYTSVILNDGGQRHNRR